MVRKVMSRYAIRVMNLDLENHPQPVRWPFFLGDAVLVLIALSIALFHPDPFSALPLLAMVLCVAGGAVLFAAPFLLEYTARQEDQARRREEDSAEVARLISQSAETLTGSVSRLGTAEAALRETLQALENAGRELKRLQEADTQALREENARLKEAATERFEAGVAAAGKAAGRIEKALKVAGDLVRETAATVQSTAPKERSAPVESVQPEPLEPPRKKKEPPASKPDPSPVASTAGSPPPEPVVPAADTADEPGAEAPTDPPSDDNGEPTFSSDGVTRLLATAYIGIGNKLYIRGEGAGLNWERGQPLKFISIGKWSWEAPEGAGPVTVRLLKNDTEWAKNDPVTIQPGEQREIAVRL